MSDIWNQIWEMAYPILIMAGTSFIMAFIPWALNEIRSSEWYKGLPWPVKKLIDFFGAYLLRKIAPSVVLQKDIAIALEKPVSDLAPTADRLRDSNFGKIPSQDADMLTKAAVQDAATTLASSNPAALKKISTWELERKIMSEIPKAVEKEKKRNRMRNRGHG